MFWREDLSRLPLVTNVYVKAIICKAFPGLSQDHVHLGDRKFHIFDEDASDWLWGRVPYITFGYKREVYDCENFTRHRLVQADRVVCKKSNLDYPLAYFEIRGYRRDNGDGHSMILELHGKGGIRLREPYDGVPIVPSDSIVKPWLVYQ